MPLPLSSLDNFKLSGFNEPKLHVGYVACSSGRLQINFVHLGSFTFVKISTRRRFCCSPPSKKQPLQPGSNGSFSLKGSEQIFLTRAHITSLRSSQHSERMKARRYVIPLGEVEAGVKLKLVLGTDGVKLNVGVVVGILVRDGLEDGAVALISVI